MTKIIQDDDGDKLVDITPDDQLKMRTPIVGDDSVGNAFAASKLIETIVWSVVVLVLLIVGLIAIHVYLHLF